jgi:hypothetical protein
MHNKVVNGSNVKRHTFAYGDYLKLRTLYIVNQNLN